MQANVHHDLKFNGLPRHIDLFFFFSEFLCPCNRIKKKVNGDGLKETLIVVKCDRDNNTREQESGKANELVSERKREHAIKMNSAIQSGFIIFFSASTIERVFRSGSCKMLRLRIK